MMPALTCMVRAAHAVDACFRAVQDQKEARQVSQQVQLLLNGF